MTCRVCGRPIRSQESLDTGLGPTCREHRQGIDQPELFEGLPRNQVSRIPLQLKTDEPIDWDKLRGMG